MREFAIIQKATYIEVSGYYYDNGMKMQNGDKWGSNEYPTEETIRSIIEQQQLLEDRCHGITFALYYSEEAQERNDAVSYDTENVLFKKWGKNEKGELLEIDQSVIYEEMTETALEMLRSLTPDAM